MISPKGPGENSRYFVGETGPILVYGTRGTGNLADWLYLGYNEKMAYLLKDYYVKKTNDIFL